LHPVAAKNHFTRRQRGQYFSSGLAFEHPLHQQINAAKDLGKCHGRSGDSQCHFQIKAARAFIPQKCKI